MVPLCLEIPPKTHLKNLPPTCSMDDRCSINDETWKLTCRISHFIYWWRAHHTYRIHVEQMDKCFNDQHPISDLTTAANIAISKQKFSIRMASLAEVLTRRQTRSPDLYSPWLTHAKSLHGSKVWEILKSSYIRPRTVQTTRGLNQNLHCHTIISFT